MSTLFAVFDDDEIVAFAGLACYRGYWCMRTCVVIPTHRGHGLQSRLIAARIRYLRARGARHVNVWVSPTNVYSLNNLIAAGFRFVREKPREFHGTIHVKLRRVLESS